MKTISIKPELLWTSNPDDDYNPDPDCIFATAKKGVDSLLIKLIINGIVFDEFAKIIDDQIKEGIAEKCKDKSITSGYFILHAVNILKSASMNLC